MKRRTLAIVVLGTMLVSSLATWFASSQIRSPAEIAARAAAPNASPILVPVEKRVLATKIVSRGTGQYGSPQPLSVTRSALKGSGGVVTSLPGVGAVVSEGNVLLTISSRPTFVLAGTQPSYRDLGPGMSGRDVSQLEQALHRLKLNPGKVDGVYDDATGRAVGLLYRRHGYQPIVASAAMVRAAQPREAALVAGSQGGGGIQLPSDEVIFVSKAPLRVSKVDSKLGAKPSGALITGTNSLVAVNGAVPVEQASLIKVGADVVIDEPALAIKTVGKVSRVAPGPGTDGTDGFHVYFQVVVPRPPPALVGASVRVTVPIKSTKEATFTVPVAALSLGPDGTSRVQRSVAGKLSLVRVNAGLSAEGYVAITPVEGSLAAGDLVVVGFGARTKAGGKK